MNKNTLILFGMYSFSSVLTFIIFLAPYIDAFLLGWNFKRGKIFSNAFSSSLCCGFVALFMSFGLSTLIAKENNLFGNKEEND